MFLHNKQLVRIEGGTALEVRENRITDLLGEWKSGFAAPLAHNTKAGIAPIDIIQSKANDVARTKAEPSKKQDDGPVAGSCQRAVVACGYDTLDIVS